MRLLIVEDDRELRSGLSRLLGQTGYEVDAFADASEGLHYLRGREYDLAIIDLVLPRMSGIALVRTLRSEGIGLPVLIVTARDALEDRVAGLDAGADDYLVKPFEMKELEARLRALLRRARDSRNDEIRIGPLVVFVGQPHIRLDEEIVYLPAGERLLLEVLALRAGRVVTKEAIADRLSRGDNPPSDTAIAICVYRLRRRFRPVGLTIRTLRGFGYILDQSDSSALTESLEDRP